MGATSRVPAALFGSAAPNGDGDVAAAGVIATVVNPMFRGIATSDTADEAGTDDRSHRFSSF